MWVRPPSTVRTGVTPVVNMSEPANNVLTATLIGPQDRPVATAGLATPGSSPTHPGPPAPSVYRDAAYGLLPRWLRMLGPVPWLEPEASTRAKGDDVHGLYRRQLAASAIGLVCEFDERRGGDSHLRECVRTALIRWQLSLRGDGRPLSRRTWDHPLHHAVASLVIQLLSETGCFQTDTLLSDIARHIKWLAARPTQVPWIEATACCALADGALLARDTSLLDVAHDRLDRLLARQNPEGWFPEQGGLDAGKLSLTVDAFARLMHHGGWNDLATPLEKALDLLMHFVHPDGRGGGCCGTRQSAFISPHGVELLASRFPQAAALALVTRKHCRQNGTDGVTAWHDDLCALLGQRIAMAAAHATAELPTACRYPCEDIGRTHFHNAKVSTFSTKAYYAVVSGRKGGALHVTWRSQEADLEDSGVTVVFPRRTATSSRWDARTRYDIDGPTVASTGVLRRPARAARSPWDRLRTWIRRLRFTRRQPAPHAGQGENAYGCAKGNRLTRDRFRRRITFGDDWIRVQDLVRCRLPCRTIIVQSQPPGHPATFVEAAATGQGPHEPIFVDGGRHIEITRVYRNGKLARLRGMPTD